MRIIVYPCTIQFHYIKVDCKGDLFHRRVLFLKSATAFRIKLFPFTVSQINEVNDLIPRMELGVSWLLQTTECKIT